MGKMDATGDRDDSNLQLTKMNEPPAKLMPMPKRLSARAAVIKLEILGFYRSTGRTAPQGDDLRMLVETAMEDWKVVPDADLVAVCARARLIAAKKPSSQGFTPMATTAEVLRAWQQLTD